MDFTKPLKITGKHHDVVAGVLCDPFEVAFPSLGLVELEDAETNEKYLVDTSSSVFLSEYKKQMENKREDVKTKLIGSGVDHFFIHTDQDIFRQLMVFIKQRRER